MKRVFALAAILALAPAPASTAELSPVGDWLVNEGYAVIRIDNCAGKLWGIVAWELKAGVDSENPDPAKKGRPIIGMPILLAMAPTKPNLWEGEIYNSQNGKTYSSRISMLDESTLKLEGCVLGGWFCGGQNWTRATSLPPGGVTLPSATKAPPPAKGPAAPTAGKKGAAASPPAQSEVCMRIADEAAAASKSGQAKK
jgi:uncharacterized protein (DUF2147 family)